MVAHVQLRSEVVSHPDLVTFIFSKFMLVILMHSNSEDLALGQFSSILLPMHELLETKSS